MTKVGFTATQRPWIPFVVSVLKAKGLIRKERALHRPG
jgi:hypothetical protein